MLDGQLIDARDGTAVLVRVQTAEVTGHRPLSLYTALRDRVGEENVFLQESLAGTGAVNGAVVGWGPLAEIRVYAGHVTLTSAPGLRNVLTDATQRAGLTETVPDRWTSSSPAGVWKLLRLVSQLFRLAPGAPGGYAFGFLLTAGYGAAWHMEDLPERPASATTWPDITLTLYRHTVWFPADGGPARHLRGDSPYFAPAGPDPAGVVPVVEPAAVPAAGPFEASDTVDRETYLGWVRRCLEHIRIGDIYQIQIGHRLDVRTGLTPLDVYRRLRDRNPSPHMYLLPHAGRMLIGASPELLFRTDGDRVVMRPIAGTARRDLTGQGNDERVRRLRASTKEQAEHIMLVDLCRNDLSRVARPHSLTVDELMVVETFSHVFHLVSTVSAELDTAADVWDTLRAAFPAGTMTGAPKLRAMEIIQGIEEQPRGAYAGAAGLVDVRGWSELALCIRTVVSEGQEYSTQSSAGIVAQSDPDKEWAETMAKMAPAYWALTGEELLP